MNKKLQSLLSVFSSLVQKENNSDTFRKKYAIVETLINTLGKIKIEATPLNVAADNTPVIDAPFIKTLKDIANGRYYDIEDIDRLLDKAEEEAKRLGVFDDTQRLFLDAAHRFNDILREAA